MEEEQHISCDKCGLASGCTSRHTDEKAMEEASAAPYLVFCRGCAGGIEHPGEMAIYVDHTAISMIRSRPVIFAHSTGTDKHPSTASWIATFSFIFLFTTGKSRSTPPSLFFIDLSTARNADCGWTRCPPASSASCLLFAFPAASSFA